MIRKLLVWLVAISAFSACAGPAGAGSVALDYATGRKVIRACILLDGVTAPSPSVFYLLDRSEAPVSVTATGGAFVFYPPKPGGWVFENPLAAPGTPKLDATYWDESLDSMDLPRLENYDLILLPVKDGGITLDSAEQQRLAAWVDEGGLLWIDRQRDTTNPGQVALFLEPTLTFEVTDETRSVSKSAADASHPLLRGRFILSGEEIELLGRQLLYSSSPEGQSALDGLSSDLTADPPPSISEVVRARAGDGTEVACIAAGRAGLGAVVVTACGVADGIQDWYQGMVGGTTPTALELPEWSLPDFKLVYNMIEWSMNWSGQHGSTRHQGLFAGPLPGPLTLMWSHLAGAAVSGAPVVDRGVAYVGQTDGTLSLLDVAPPEARSGGRTDDGLADWADGAGADEIGRLTLAGAGLVGAPALTSVTDAFPVALGAPVAGTPLAPGPRPIVVVAARSPSDTGSWLYAFPADPDIYAVGTPANAIWTATLNDAASIKYGVATTGPVAVDNMIVMVTSDSGTDQQPNRDGHLLLYDASADPAAPAPEDKTPLVAVSLARGGQALSITSPPAVAYTRAWDDFANTSNLVQAVVLTGNGLPRVGTAATGQLRVVPLAVRLPVSGWDHTWLDDPTVGDTAANQLVKVYADGVQIPPHQGDDPNAPPNYVRRVYGNYMEIVFTRFSVFRRGAYPTGGEPLRITYRDTSGETRTVNVEFQSGSATFLRARVAENGQSAPAVAGETVFAVGDAINGYPSNSVYGKVTALGLGVERRAGTLWTFEGDITGGPDRHVPANPRNYFSEFPFTPAYADDVAYVASNYAFSQEQGSRDTASMPYGPTGALYALNAKASPNLLSVSPSDPNLYDPVTAVVSADPTLPGGALDSQAPVGQSADPNQVVQAGKRGVSVWITTQTDPTDPNYDSPTYALRQRTGMTVNWTVDFGNGIVRLGPGALGRYQGKALRVRYFSGGAIPNGGDGVIMQADRLVNWVYHFASFHPGTGDEMASARIISPPVAADGAVHVMVRSNQEDATGGYRRYLVSLRENPAESSAADRLLNPWGAPRAEWQPVGSPVANEEIVAAPAAAGHRVIVATRVGTAGLVEGFANANTIVADNERVIEAQGAGQVSRVGLGSREPDPSPAAGTVDSGIPGYDTYADSAYRGFSRPSRARHLAGGRTLVCDTGHDRVVEIGRGGDVAWQYPGVLLTKTRYQAGLATAVNGSPVVTGDVNTLWTSIVSAGDRFRIDADGTWYTIDSVDSDAQITLNAPYGGAGGAPAPYTIVHIHREATPEEQRLLGPLDARRYRQRQAPFAPVDAAITDPTGEMSRTDTTGSATATSGSTLATGAGTTWLTSARAGDWFRLEADGLWHVIASVDSDDQITLTEAYAGAGGSGAYTIAVAISIEWRATLIADTGHNRVLEVMQPLLNGKYRPWVYGVPATMDTADGYGQASVTTGSDAVTRSGGSLGWPINIRPGDYFRVDSDGTWYRVASVGPGDALRLSQPYAGATGAADFTAQRRFYYSQYTQELVGPKTAWDLAAPKALTVKLSPSYAQRLGNPVTASGNTTRLICAVINNPPDPSGRDRYLSVVDVVVGYQALPLDPRVVLSSTVQLHTDAVLGNGANMFAPRAGVDHDLVRVRQVEQIPRAPGDYNTLIVDDVGVKEINNATWDSTGNGLVFEFTGSAKPAPTTATYLEEMQALNTRLGAYAPRPPYPALIDETSNALRETAYQNALTYASNTVDRQALNGQVDFLPVAAWKNRANSTYWANGGTYTIVNAYGDPYQAVGQPAIGAPVKSEVFEVDPRWDIAVAYRAGRRIVKWDFDSTKTGQLTGAGDENSPRYGFGAWPHFIVPDPSRSPYPWLAGATYGLKQPQGVERY